MKQLTNKSERKLDGFEIIEFTVPLAGPLLTIRIAVSGIRHGLHECTLMLGYSKPYAHK